MCPLHYGSLWTTVSIIHSIKRSGRSLLHLKGHFNLSDGQQGCKPTGFKKKYDYMEAYEKMTPLFTWSVSSVNTFLMSLQSQVFFNTAGCSVCKLGSHLNRGFLVSHRSLPQYAIGFSVRSNHNPPPPQAPPSHPNINPGNAEALKDSSPHWLHPLLLLPCICSISSTAPPGPGSAISVFKKKWPPTPWPERPCRASSAPSWQRSTSPPRCCPSPSSSSSPTSASHLGSSSNSSRRCYGDSSSSGSTPPEWWGGRAGGGSGGPPGRPCCRPPGCACP